MTMPATESKETVKRAGVVRKGLPLDLAGDGIGVAVSVEMQGGVGKGRCGRQERE